MNSRTIQSLSLCLFAALLLWGSYTLIVWLGVPYHGAALLTQERMNELTASCAPTAYLCNGFAVLMPVLLRSISRTGPLLGYGIVSLLAWAAYAGWQYLAGRKNVSIVWAPWKILLLFVASVWLISLILSTGTVGNRPMRAYIEPTPETYNLSEHALEGIRNDYRNFLAGGCLDPVNPSQESPRIYTLQMWCIQKAFAQRVLPQVLFLFVLLGELLILGRMALGWIRYKAPTLLLETLFSAGVGAGFGIAILWTIAVAGLYVSAAGWLLAVLIPVAGFRHTRYWAETFVRHTWERRYRWADLSLILGWLLVSYLALNFLEVVRPFPIGWDDLGSYLNRPRLLVSYGRFISSMSPFDWSYLTSLGFLLFGFDSTMGSTASMMINWSAGVLALLSIFAFARTFLGDRAGFLSALLYYSLPLVGHFSFADMKIDNAIFFFGVMATLAILMAVTLPKDNGETPHDPDPASDASRYDDATPYVQTPHGASLRLLFIAGFLLGIAFATKVTTIMLVLSLAAMLTGACLGWTGFAGMLFLTGFLFAWREDVSVQLIAARILQATPPEWLGPLVIACLFAIGIGFLAWSAFKRLHAMIRLGTLIAALGLGFAVSVLPWMEHSAIAGGRWIPTLASAPNTIAPGINTDNLPPELLPDKKGPACQATGVTEELDRYWGFAQGWSHYLTLPWRTVMNMDATGYYVTTIPALLLFPLLLLLPYFWSKEGRWLRLLSGATLMILLQWMFLASGVPWYGIAMLLGLIVGLETLLRRAPDSPNRILTGVFIAFSLLFAFNLRFWQLEQQRNIFEYSMGKISAEALREITIPYYDDISDEVVARHASMPDRPYLYRVGTFIPYFIPKNLEIIGINDHQLDVFNCMYQERDAALTVRRLKALGFNSIIFDTNTATIERDEAGSLHKKVDAFVDFVNNPSAGVRLLVSDTNAGLAFIVLP